MTLLLDADALQQRRAVARLALAPLAQSLAAELEPVARRLPELPLQKALLSRDGGRCRLDGATLTFDPWEPVRHRCPRCGRTYEGDRHHGMWLMWQHLWLAERCVIGAALHAVTGSESGAIVARHVLAQASERYLELPNRDNVLGPSRPFFSTYLESIWLLQLCIALDLLETAGAQDSLASHVRERVIEPSAALIASFDEGRSNRQVWNAAALLAAGALLDREQLIERAAHGPSGLRSGLERGLLPDGTWYEGENYHLFAHRGFWYGVTICEARAVPIPSALLSRYQEGFATPLITALPDMTFPSRRDSQYAVTLRQWRFAESLELGFSRQRDERLLEGLHELYGFDGERRDTQRWCSTAEAERNAPPSRLSRADLGWKSLLFALPDLPEADTGSGRESVLLESQGFAILRPAPAVYFSLDYGQPGGGHGHPDRLGVILAVGEARWLDDPGTGSYVDPSLFWYRSTLAHNAPLVDGRSQLPATGMLRAWDAQCEAAWVEAELPADATAEVRFRRTLIAYPEYALDVIAWEGGEGHLIDLPYHAGYESAAGVPWSEASEPFGVDAGFRFLHAVQHATVTPGFVSLAIDAHGRRGYGALLPLLPRASTGMWWRARHPGPPNGPAGGLIAFRTNAARGALASAWSWSGPIELSPAGSGGIAVRLLHQPVIEHVHRRSASGWCIERAPGSVVTLSGIRTPPAAPIDRPSAPVRAVRAISLSPTHPFVRELAEESYRRSEVSWEEAGAPRGRVELRLDGERLLLTVIVRKRPLVFRPAGYDPALDNENPDVHGDGVQLHVLPPGSAEPVTWLMVPEPPGPSVRVHRSGAGELPHIDPAWHRTADGYTVTTGLSFGCAVRDGLRFALDVLINEAAEGRMRRRGQLVLSGGAGEYVYLRGDRQPIDRFLWFEVAGV